MHTTNLRKVGGSIMLALPPAILDLLHLRAGATVGVAVEGDRLVIDPRPRPRYTLAELLAASDYSEPQRAEEREWVDAPARRPRTDMRRGDIYLVTLDPSEGREQRGHRPVLVVSPAAFNEATKLPVIVPITNGGDFARRLGFAVPISGIRTTGVIRCDQPRVLDLQARSGRKVDTLPAPILDEVMAKVALSRLSDFLPGRRRHRVHRAYPARCAGLRGTPVP